MMTMMIYVYYDSLFYGNDGFGDDYYHYAFACNDNDR